MTTHTPQECPFDRDTARHMTAWEAATWAAEQGYSHVQSAGGPVPLALWANRIMPFAAYLRFVAQDGRLYEVPPPTEPYREGGVYGIWTLAALMMED